MVCNIFLEQQRGHGGEQIRPQARTAFPLVYIFRSMSPLELQLCHPSEPGHLRLLRPQQMYYLLRRVVYRRGFSGGFPHRRVPAIPVLYSCIFHPRIVDHPLRRLHFRFLPARPCDKSCLLLPRGIHDVENVATMCSDLRSAVGGFCIRVHQ